MTGTAPRLETDVFLRDLPIVDAHHHFWELDGPVTYPWLQTPPWLPFRYGDYSAIRRSYLPDSFRRDHGAHNIVASVHMEAEPACGMAAAEIDWLETLGDAAPIAAAAQIWLDRDDVADQLRRLLALPLVRSVRHKPRAQPREAVTRGGTGSMDDPAWRAGYAALAGTPLHFELQVPYWHLDAAAELARDFPTTTIILNHCGLPADRSAGGLADWRQAVAGFAECDNTVVKLSGIGLAPGWWPELQNGWILRELVSIFGADRAMFASNFPVDGLCIGYDRLFSAYKRAVASLPHTDIASLFAGTAIRVYRLDPAIIPAD